MSDDNLLFRDNEHQTSQEILDEYRDAGPKRRFDMWFRFRELRDRFDESERANYQKNDAEALTWFRSL
jgi:hypothetical protein